MWTEILNEDLAVLHIHDSEVLMQVSEYVSQRDVEAAMSKLEAREAKESWKEQFREEVQKMEEQLEERREMRRKLEQAGYEDIPL